MVPQGEGSHKLHLVLDAEELMLRVKASIGTIRKLRDELVSRNVAVVVFGQLVCESSVVVDGGNRKNTLGVCGLVVGILDRLLAGSNGRDLATVTHAGLAVRVRRVESGIRSGIGA